MKKITITAVFLFGVAGCDSDTKEIIEAKAIVRANLFDGASAQFSDTNYYENTNYVCGQVNAKNRLGGYVGPKRFIVSLKEKSNYFDPDREAPKSPTSPTSLSTEAAVNYALEIAAWADKLQKIHTEAEIFDALSLKKCTNTPPKEKQTNGSLEPSLEKQKNNQTFEFNVDTTKIPFGFNGDDLSSVSNKVEKLTKRKDQIETTDEYNKRMSILSFDPTPENFDRLYAIKIQTGAFNPTDSIEFDADKGKVFIKYTGPILNGFCKDNITQRYKKEHPVICHTGNGVSLSVSNKSKFFLKTMTQHESISRRDEYNFIDSFSLSREKIAELPKVGNGFSSIGISTLLVGNIVKDQVNPQHSWVEPYSTGEKITVHAASGKVIPFNVKHIVNYSSSTGEILARKDF